MDIERVNQKYKDKMLQLAFIVSGWSSQPIGKQHGCVLALDGKYIVATGFNGHDRSALPVDENIRIVHAEENAVLNAKLVKVDLSKCVAFVTKRPCEPCREGLKKAGILAVFWLQGDAGLEVFKD